MSLWSIGRVFSEQELHEEMVFSPPLRRRRRVRDRYFTAFPWGYGDGLEGTLLDHPPVGADLPAQLDKFEAAETILVLHAQPPHR